MQHSPERELSTAQWLWHKFEGRLGTIPVGWDCTGRLAAAGPGLLGAAPGRGPPGRFCELGCASECPAGAADASPTVLGFVPLQRLTQVGTQVPTEAREGCRGIYMYQQQNTTENLVANTKQAAAAAAAQTKQQQKLSATVAAAAAATAAAAGPTLRWQHQQQ